MLREEHIDLTSPLLVGQTAISSSVYAHCLFQNEIGDVREECGIYGAESE